MVRKKLFAANWKMNKTIKESVSFISDFKNSIKNSKNDILICPPFTALDEVKKSIKSTKIKDFRDTENPKDFLVNSKIKLGAQNMHFEEKGAFTGEVSASMLKDTGCEYVILGHSERRQHFNETDELINKKIKTALKNNLKVILCIGETLEQRDSNKTMQIIESQLKNCLKNITDDEMKDIVVAYEPVWAIGTGKNATPEQTEEVHKFIRELLKKLYNVKISNEIRILYGGSVNADNIKELMKIKDIDGALVGGASLEAKSFSEICNT